MEYLDQTLIINLMTLLHCISASCASGGHSFTETTAIRIKVISSSQTAKFEKIKQSKDDPLLLCMSFYLVCTYKKSPTGTKTSRSQVNPNQKCYNYFNWPHTTTTTIDSSQCWCYCTCYSGTPLYGHLYNQDTIELCTKLPLK